MPKKDPRVDAYIAKSAEFARPILKHLRKLVHQGCSDAVETIKWGMPYFDYKGLLCGMAAFKAHCALFFWRDVEVAVNADSSEKSMGQFGRIRSRADLPNDAALLACIRKAVQQRDVPDTVRTPPRKPAKEASVPADLKLALSANAKAMETFRNFSPSHRREYIEWITDAKRPETRQRRLTTALEWLAEGKPQNWKYRAQE